MNEVPARAHVVDYGVVFKVIERPINDLPQVMEKIRIVECPACSSKYDDPGACKTVTCPCGWSMRFDGNTYIWRDLPAAAE